MKIILYTISQRILQCFLIAIMWRESLSHRRVHYSKVPAHKAMMHPGLGRRWYTGALYNAPCYYLLYYITAHCIPRALLIPGSDTSWPATILMGTKREGWKTRSYMDWKLGKLIRILRRHIQRILHNNRTIWGERVVKMSCGRCQHETDCESSCLIWKGKY